MNRLIFFSLTLTIISCSQENIEFNRTKQEQLELDIKRIEGYISENNLDGFLSTEKGLYYKLLGDGNSIFPISGDTLSVEYIGKFLDGSEFDRSNTDQPFEFVLGMGQVIEGWELGLTKIDEGGSGILIIPSGMGYGQSPNGSIPENSVLIFRIDLVDVR